ncbi:tetratricopeptide repeat protein [Oceanibaculum pacificum]|uniref:tetratricopeptide repeat protein n=1 Tax=Oceanibaculum pacificum TaxID=580166 RepID=UPI0009FCF22F|nr:tetratricopeptide repeat protein [Oceanibaculum pacificum]
MKRASLFLALLLAAILWGGAAHATGANSRNDARLEPLFQQLKNAKDPAVAKLLEAQIWHIWTWTDIEDVNLLMRMGIGAMEREDYEAALLHFGEMVRIAPDFAEGWNKRATVYYLQGNYTASVIDIERVLEIEPKHFGALAGLGLIYLQLDRKKPALRAFQKALEIHPNMPNARDAVKDLQRAVEGERT